MTLIIFTELDEILSNSRESDYQSIVTVVQKLKQHQIPLIPISSKTRAEVTPWLGKSGLADPFIVEGGSGIFIFQEDRRFNTWQTSTIDNYHLHQLGCSYTEARAALKAVQEEISKILRGFGDLDEENIQPLINGNKLAAKQAKAREFSEYFLTPNRLEIKQLQELATEYGFKIIAGDRLSLILGARAEVKESINWLTQNAIGLVNNLQTVQTVGLGCTQQDLAMLETVDIPVVIPTSTGIDPCLNSKDWQTANSAGVPGWIESLEQICRQYL